MLEPWRSHYLGAMGVPQFVARVSLPGAAVSRPIAWDAARVAVSPAAPVPAAALPIEVAATAQETPVRPRVAPSSRLPSIETTTKPQRSVAAEKSPLHSTSGRPPSQASDAQPFALTLANVGHDLLFVDYVSPAVYRSTSYRQLLGNVMSSIGRAVGEVELFEWPCVDLLPHLPRDRESAKEAVAGCLMRRLGDTTERRLLLLGQSSVCIDPAAMGAMGYATAAIVADTSLSDCLSAPDAKRSLWHALRHLAANGD